MYEFKKEDVYQFAAYVNAQVHEKGDELFFRYCPKCDGGENKDLNTFSINLQNGAFKCFRASCGYHGHFVELARDFGFKLEDEQEKRYIQLPQREIKTKQRAIEYLQSRGISERIARKYKITVRNDNPDILVFPFYDEQNILRFIKYRNTKYKGSGNKEWCEKNTQPILFGMAQCEDFKRLIITEGQIDSLSVAECGIKNAVSVPTGAQGFTWLSACWDWINRFDEVVVFGDREHGKITLIDTLSKRLKTKVKCVQAADYLCEKDANDILRKYGKEAIIKAIENAQIQEIKYVKRLADVEYINLNDLPKIKTGIRAFDKLCGGLLLGHVILLSGKRGEGKSTLASQIVAEALEQEKNVFLYSGEMPAYQVKNWLNLQIAGNEHIITKTDEYGVERAYLSSGTIEKINAWYHDRAYIFDNSAVDDEFSGLLDTITEAICRYGIQLVCIDNLMTAMDCDTKTDLYRQQSNFVKSLQKMAQRYNVAVILVAHPKKSNNDFDNDTVSGSADITNAVSFVLNYERDKKQEGQGRLMVTKNRINGALIVKDDAIPLYYGRKSKRIVENSNFDKVYSCFDISEELPQFDGNVPWDDSF